MDRQADTVGTSTRAVLVDPELDAALARDGFVITPLLDAEARERVLEDYNALAPPGETGLSIDYSRFDRAHVRAVTDLLRPIWDRHMPALFVDHHAILSTFIAKHPGDGGEMRIHREPTFIERDRGHTHNIWIPVTASTVAADNGVLMVVPGTQRMRSWLSGHDTPEEFKPYERFLREHARPVDVPAGHALVFDSELLHFSESNHSDAMRLAFACVVAPRAEPLVHVVAAGRRRRRIYAIDLDFIIDCHPMQARTRLEDGTYELLREEEDTWQLTGAELAAAIGVDTAPEPEPCTGSAPIVIDPDAPRLRTDRPENLRAASHDVELGAAEVDLAHDAPEGVVVRGHEGQVAWFGASAIRERIRDATLAASLEEFAAASASASASATVVCLDPHSRLDLGGASSGVSVLVYDAPTVAAGVAADSGTASAQPGARISVPAGEGLSLWNAGPGPLWAVIAIEGNTTPHSTASESTAPESGETGAPVPVDDTRRARPRWITALRRVLRRQ